MFTGIVEEVGTVVSVERKAESARLTVEAPLASQGTAVGDSIAVNGACLTVVRVDGTRLGFDAVPETLQRTSLRMARPGQRVNLERALAAGGRLGGHFVQGHVDGTGRILSITPEGGAHVVRAAAPPEVQPYLVPKGSVAVDGISLTVAGVEDGGFKLWIIPHTWKATNLRDRRPGDPVNLEADILAKYVHRLMSAREGRAGVTEELLATAGFDGPVGGP